MHARSAALALVTAPQQANEITLSVSELGSALALVSHATRSAFDTSSSVDFEWSPPASSCEVAAWSVTATDGHRLARFTSDRTDWFREPHAHSIALPGWIFDWIKDALPLAQVRIRIDADGAAIALPQYGTFRPIARPRAAVAPVIRDLRGRDEKREARFHLLVDARKLIRKIEADKRQNRDAAVFVSELGSAGWSAHFVDGADRGVALNPSYLTDALKSLARVAKDFDAPSIHARWAGKMDPVTFTAPHLLCVVMPRHP